MNDQMLRWKAKVASFILYLTPGLISVHLTRIFLGVQKTASTCRGVRIFESLAKPKTGIIKNVAASARGPIVQRPIENIRKDDG